MSKTKSLVPYMRAADGGLDRDAAKEVVADDREGGVAFPPKDQLVGSSLAKKDDQRPMTVRPPPPLFLG